MNKLLIVALTLTALFSHNVCEASCNTPPIGPTGSSPQGPAGPTGPDGPIDISFASAVFSIDLPYGDDVIYINDLMSLPFPTPIVSNGITQLDDNTFQVSKSGYYLVEYTLNMADLYDGGSIPPSSYPATAFFYLFRVGDSEPFEPIPINVMNFNSSYGLIVSGHIIVYLDANDRIQLFVGSPGVFFERGNITIIQLHH